VTAAVVDASVVIDLLLGVRRGSVRLHDALLERRVVLAPDLLDVEAAQVLRRYVRARELSGQQATEFVTDLVALPIQRVPMRLLVGRAFALRDNVTAYDGVYLALAEACAVPLWTADRRLAGIPGCDVTVEFLA
jgi:predicted nucleic acid-binding protein